jgi:Ca-activated chloride channel family protein
MDDNRNGHRPGQVTPSTTVSLSARPERQLIRPGGSYRHVDFQLTVSKPPHATNARRMPVRLALVLDRSGSMAGDKLPTAKRATLAVLESLDERDHVAVIAYDDQIDVVQRCAAATPQVKSRVRSALSEIQPRASTALHQGWLTGAHEIASSEPAAGESGIARVFLLTDGLANVGLTDPEQIAGQAADIRRNAGVGTSTFGIGADYNELLLGPMAVAGGGQFHHLRTADEIANTFVGELGDLLAVAASQVTLELEVEAGITAEMISAYRLDADTGRPNVHSIVVGDLLAGEERPIIIRFGFPARNGHNERAIHARVTWRVDGATWQDEWQSVEFRYASDAACDDEPRDRSVMHWVGLHHAERAQARVAQASFRGDRVGAINLAREVAAWIAQYANGDADLGQAVGELKRLEDEVSLAPMAAMAVKETAFRSTSFSRAQKDHRHRP